MTNPNMMTAGGPGGDPYMGLLGTIAPQTSGLLQMPQTQTQGIPSGYLAPQAMPAMMQSYQPQNFGVSPGTNWSQAAYQLAGSPNQNPFRGSVLPPANTAASSPAGGGATALGGTALGILGALGKAAGGTGSTASNLGNAITGLLGNNGNPFGTYTSGNIANVGNVGGNSIASAGASAAAPYTTGLLSDAANAAGISGIAPVGTGAIDAAADAGATAAIPGLEAGADAAGTVGGGLLGADTAAAAASPALEAVGTGAIDAAADAGASIGIDAGADAGAAAAGADAGGIGAGAGVGLGAASLAALPTAAFLYGVSQPAVQLTGKYWGGVQNSLQQAIASGDRGQIAAQVGGLLAQPQSQIPQNIQQLVYSTGFVPASGWGQGPTMANPALAAQLTQQTGGFKGGNNGGGNISVNRA